MSTRELYKDVVIIGAGSAGLVARRAAEKAGASTLLCDGGTLGTTCARVGCMPSKLLIAAARAARAVRRAPHFGVLAEPPTIHKEAVMRRVQEERDRFVGFVLQSIHDLPEDTFLPHNVRFVEPGILQTESGTRIHYKAVVIATGTTPFIPPPFKALDHTLLTTDSIFERTTLPNKLAVIGAGVVGLELGQAIAALNCEVTIFNRGESLGILRDPESHKHYKDALCKDLRLLQNTTVSKAEEQNGKANLTWKDTNGETHKESFDAVLSATGRRPQLQGLALDALGISDTKSDNLHFCPELLQLDKNPLFLAGDVNGVRNVLHEASDDGRIAGENAAWYALEGEDAVCCHPRRTPMGIAFTFPEQATGGLLYNELPEEHLATGRVELANQGRSRVDLENHGALAIYGSKKTGELLGFEMCGPAAEHIAHLLTWAIQQHMTVSQALEMPFYHPVVEEGVRTALRNLARAVGRHRHSRVRCQEAAPTEV